MNSEPKVVAVVVDSVLTTSLWALTVTFSTTSALGRRVTVTVENLPGVMSASILIVDISGNDTSMVYPLPGGSGEMRNSPFASVIAVWFTPRLAFARAMRAVGRG